MKRSLFILLPILFFLLACLFWVVFRIHIKDDILGNAQLFFILFVAANIVHTIYFIYIFYLRRKKIVKNSTVFYSLPPLVIFFLASIIYYSVSMGRGRYLNLGPDPFAPSSNITSIRRVPMWSVDYWISDKKYYEKYYDKKIADMQKTRQGSLIGHVGTDLQGWSEEQIISAFGTPTKIIQVSENSNKFMYHPWTNHPDWEMPVYVQDGVLLKIGD